MPPNQFRKRAEEILDELEFISSTIFDMTDELKEATLRPCTFCGKHGKHSSRQESTDCAMSIGDNNAYCWKELDDRQATIERLKKEIERLKKLVVDVQENYQAMDMNTAEERDEWKQRWKQSRKGELEWQERCDLYKAKFEVAREIIAQKHDYELPKWAFEFADQEIAAKLERR